MTEQKPHSQKQQSNETVTHGFVLLHSACRDPSRHGPSRRGTCNKAVMWAFDNDFIKTPGPTWGQSARSPSEPQDTSKAAHRVLVELPSGTYTVRFFNTWDGGAYYHETTLATVEQDGRHLLLIPITQLATTTRTPDEVWDGADCILVIEPQP